MGLFRSQVYVDPHDDAADLAEGALAQFHDAHQDLLEANDILAASLDNDKARKADLEARINRGETAKQQNAIVAKKLADLLGL